MWREKTELPNERRMTQENRTIAVETVTMTTTETIAILRTSNSRIVIATPMTKEDNRNKEICNSKTKDKEEL